MSAATQHRRTASQRGQSLVLITVFMMSLLGMAALAIDVGSWYQTKRSLQADADAAALAGASQLPAGWSFAQTAAQANYAKNGSGSDTVTYQNVTVSTTNDSVKVTTSRNANSYFARLFGHGSATITASATATVRSFTSIGSGSEPWGVMKQTFTVGASYPMYTDNRGNANNGALQDYYANPGCSPGGNPNGANDYANEIAGSFDTSGLTVCPIKVNDLIPTKTGNNSGKTASGLNARITANGGWKPVSSIVTFTAGGLVNVLLPNSPQLVTVPVIANPNGTNVWPNPPNPVKVVGFAVFVITSCGSGPSYSYCSSSDGGQVNGTYVGMMQQESTSFISGAWDGTNNTLYTVQMTG
jgi:Flp pilus assembly protein TadG